MNTLIKLGPAKPALASDPKPLANVAEASHPLVQAAKPVGPVTNTSEPTIAKAAESKVPLVSLKAICVELKLDPRLAREKQSWPRLSEQLSAKDKWRSAEFGL